LVEILSKVCYSTADRRVGTIYNYRVNRADWGFIASSAGKDYFFHKDSFYGEAPANGLKVIFAPFEGMPRARAFPVLPLKDSSGHPTKG
jgi:serine/threonine-protein kinase